MSEHPPKPARPESILLTEDSDYWIGHTPEGDFSIGRKGEKDAFKNLDHISSNADFYRKMRVLLYIQKRAERQKDGSLVREEVDGEVLNMQNDISDEAPESSRFIFDHNCYTAVAYVMNPEETSLKDLEFADAGEDSFEWEKLSHDDLAKKALEVGLPAFGAVIGEKVYRELGTDSARDHNFIIFDQDPAGDLICFEKTELGGPIRLTTLRKIHERYSRYSDRLWSVQKI